MCGVRIRGIPGDRAKDFLKNEHISDLQVQKTNGSRGAVGGCAGSGRWRDGRSGCGRRPKRWSDGRTCGNGCNLWRLRGSLSIAAYLDPFVDESCRGCAFWQATPSVAPGVKGNFIVRRIEKDGLVRVLHERFENFVAALRDGFQVIGLEYPGCRRAGESSDEIEVTWLERRFGIDRQDHPGACVAAFMHPIIDKTSVASDRDALTRGPKVSFGGNCVLIVAERVAYIGEKLDKHDTQVRNMAFLPRGHDEG